MARYEILFLDSAGKVTATEEFIAGLEIDESRIAPLLARACGDEYAGFELWQGNRRISGCSGPMLPKIAGNRRAVKIPLLGPVSASLRPVGQSGADTAGNSRRRFIRSFAIAATVVLAFGGAFSIVREQLSNTISRNTESTFRHTEIEIEAKAVPPDLRGSGVSEALVFPHARTAQNDAMLQALANYQRLLLEYSAAEETASADRTVAAPKPSARIRRRPVRYRVRYRVEIGPPVSGPPYDHSQFPGYTGR
jgi:hypothetical protein